MQSLEKFTGSGINYVVTNGEGAYVVIGNRKDSYFAFKNLAMKRKPEERISLSEVIQGELTETINLLAECRGQKIGFRNERNEREIEQVLYREGVKEIKMVQINSYIKQ